jgi:hypothetical protein
MPQWRWDERLMFAVGSGISSSSNSGKQSDSSRDTGDVDEVQFREQGGRLRAETNPPH